MTALLQTWEGTKKEPGYVAEARRIGLRIIPADVNVSNAGWTMDTKRKAIRRGLVSIKGIGDASATAIAALRPFRSIEDMIERIPSRQLTGGKKYLADGSFSGTLEHLRTAGALESLGVDR